MHRFLHLGANQHKKKSQNNNLSLQSCAVKRMYIYSCTGSLFTVATLHALERSQFVYTNIGPLFVCLANIRLQLLLGAR